MEWSLIPQDLLESAHIRTITIEPRGELPLSEVLTKQERAAYPRSMYRAERSENQSCQYISFQRR